MNNIIKLIRPYQWVKNFFVFMPLFFSGQLTNLSLLWQTVVAFIIFSFTASSIYCFNDIIDVEKDRRHSEKCKRPIAAGKISITGGYVIMAACILLAAAATMLLEMNRMETVAVAGFYFVMEIAYCCQLKRYAVVDVCILALGFVLRIIIGGEATGIVPSHWLVMMTFLLTLLLSLAKRRDDVLKFRHTGEAPRHNTKRYNLDFINQAITITSTGSLVCYIMYTIQPDVVSRLHFDYVYLTSVFVLLGILRYLQLALVDEKTGDPTKLVLSDRFLQLTVLMWFASYLVIIYIL